MNRALGLRMAGAWRYAGAPASTQAANAFMRLRVNDRSSFCRLEAPRPLVDERACIAHGAELDLPLVVDEPRRGKRVDLRGLPHIAVVKERRKRQFRSPSSRPAPQLLPPLEMVRIETVSRPFLYLSVNC